MQLSDILNALRAAWLKKKPLLGEIECLRLLNGAASGTPGFVGELYGSHLVAYDYGAGLRETFQPVAAEWLAEFNWSSISLLDRTQPGEDGREGSKAVAGTPPTRLVVREGPLHFKVEPQHPRNVGLFLDTRELRIWLRQHSAGKRVLNLFSYTCSLGLSALSGGAEEVVNVDVSDRYLKWGRENLALNNLPESKCRFLRMDSERYLDWAAKKNLGFDHIVLDPPVFSRFEGKTFRFSDDYFRLASKCAALLSPSGVLHAVTNFSGITSHIFKQRLLETFDSDGRAVKEIRELPLPYDFDVKAGEERQEGNAVMMQVGTSP